MNIERRESPEEPLPPLYKASSVISVLVAAVCAVLAVFFVYLNINPPEPLDGDIDFGDGTGFVLGGVAACFSLAALASGVLVPVLWRRGHVSASAVFAVLALPIWGIVAMAASQVVLGPS